SGAHGEPYTFSVWYVPLSGDAVGVLFEDVTEQEVNRRTRERYIAALERTNRELDDFAYVASHDLRAPLRDVDNLATWVAEDAGHLLPAEARGHLTRLQGRVRRMEDLLVDLLAYARAGRQPEASEVFGLQTALVRAIDQ